MLKSCHFIDCIISCIVIAIMNLLVQCPIFAINHLYMAISLVKLFPLTCYAFLFLELLKMLFKILIVFYFYF